MSTKSMRTKVKMRGFMCQSPGCTAVSCMPDNMQSVIVPGKSNRRSMMVNHHHKHGNIGRNVKYSRLVEADNILSKGKNDREILLSLGGKNNGKGDDHHQSRNLHQQQKQGDADQSSSASSSATDVFQVVVLRVSLHCQGCAGKVKKHLSRMQGVTSFSIDLETKRVTVMGHVSPSNVLESISKIKRAEFWTC